MRTADNEPVAASFIELTKREIDKLQKWKDYLEAEMFFKKIF